MFEHREQIKSTKKISTADVLHNLRMQRASLRLQIEDFEIDYKADDLPEQLSEQNNMRIKLKNCRTKIENLEDGKPSHGDSETYLNSHQEIPTGKR